MERPRTAGYGWSLVFTAALAVASNANAQLPALDVVFKSSADLNSVAIERPAAETSAGATPTFRAAAVPMLLELELSGALAPQAATSPSIALSENSANSAIAWPPEADRNLIESRSVACRAACEWLPARQLRQHAQSVEQLYCDQDDTTRQAAHVIARFLRMQAEQQQDMSAAIALRAYYAQSAIVEQFTLLDESVAELEKQRERQASIQARGLAATVDLTSLDRESIALRLQRILLQQRVRQLRQALNDATHVAFDWQAAEVEPLEVRAQTLDAVYLQQFALTHRHDLLALKFLCSQIDTDTAPHLASIVSSATGMASLPLPKRCLADRLLGREDNTVLTENLREAVGLACEMQAKAIGREISEKSIALELAYERIALAQESIASWMKRAEQLQRLAKLGDSRAADIAQAQASQLTAKAIEIERRLEAKLAEVALAEATGGLCQRCCRGLAWLVTSPAP